MHGCSGAAAGYFLFRGNANTASQLRSDAALAPKWFALDSHHVSPTLARFAPSSLFGLSACLASCLFPFSSSVGRSALLAALKWIIIIPIVGRRDRRDGVYDAFFGCRLHFCNWGFCFYPRASEDDSYSASAGRRRKI